MEDKYENAKKAAHAQMMRELEYDKISFIRKMKESLGDELENDLIEKDRSHKISFWHKIKTVLGL